MGQAKLKINHVGPIGSGKVISVHFDNVDVEHKAWASAPFCSKLVAGAEVLIGTEVVTNPDDAKYNAGKKEVWIRSVDGEGEKAPRAGGGGKGSYQRPESETLSIMAQTALKEAVALLTETDPLAKPEHVVAAGHVFFKALVAWTKSAKGELS